MKKRGLCLLLLVFSPFGLWEGKFFAAEIKNKLAPQNLKPTAAPQTSLEKPLLALSTRGIPLNKNVLKPPEPQVNKYNQPWDLVQLVPILRDINRLIPRRFSLADHDFRLSSDQVVINHQFFDARSRAFEKRSIITLFYSGALGTQMGTHLEMPLFYSPNIGLFNWERYPLGNYTMTVNRNNLSREESLYIRAQTRF